MEAFNVPAPSINVIAAHTTIAMDFDTVQDLNAPTTTSSKRTGILCVLGSIALAMSYSTATKLTTGVVLGFCSHQAARLTSLVQSIPDVSQVPMMLPLLFINILSETRAHRILGRKQAIVRLEVDLGVHWGVQADLRPQDMSLETATRQLTVCGSEVPWDVHSIEAQLEMVTLVSEVQDSINDQSAPYSKHSSAMVAFRARSRRIRQTLSGLMHWARYNQQRIQVQLQTIYSFTSQRDNELSYRTAIASQKIAEATQRDGVLMKQLAAQSKALALRTWRDGVDMRAMAVITLITLPGTFTATLFSTSFFNFEPATSGEHVSSWIWLYFVVTAAFTALCLFGWYYSSQSMARAAQKTPVGGDSHEDEKMEDSDSRVDEMQTEDTKITSPDVRPPPDRLAIDQNTNLSLKSVAAATTDLMKPFSNSGFPQPAFGSINTALARAHWDASDLWGAQSHGEPKKACAMCAQHLE
ncbi:hypothetical protein MBLNU13_g05283t2 [Cladosporium sp. NU13]